MLNAHTERIQLFCFGVDDPFPLLPIPLKPNEQCVLDVGAVYNLTFADDRWAHGALDYDQLPLNFERYSPPDQARIRAVITRLATETNRD